MMPESRIDRRTMLIGLTGVTAGLATDASIADEAAVHRTGLGLVIYDCVLRRKWLLKQKPRVDLFEPFTFLQHCNNLGAGGMQAALGVMDKERIGRLRDFAERNTLFIEAIVKPPVDDADLARFESEIRTAAEMNAQAARTVIMPGRRYEQFQSMADFRESVERGRRMLERAAPIVEKHRVPLAVENHKDQRVDQRVALFKKIDSEFIGACVDTGNSFALLDDPLGAIEALAPYAFSIHLKDQALRSYEDGFLLGDIPLGQGSFDLKRMVAILKKAKPKSRFALELITRDPLKVPCLLPTYWRTMSNVAGSDLARTLRFVRQHPATHLQQVSSLPLDKQVELEDANVAASLRYAREELGL